MDKEALYYKQTIGWLNKIGTTLSAEKDTNNLLKIILEGSMEITSSDGGSIYIVEKDKNNDGQLKFVASRNMSRDFPFKSFSIPMDENSISGACAVSQKCFKFDNIKTDVAVQLGLSHNDYFDRSINYKTVNMLVIPLINMENVTIGVLQLINKKTTYEIKLINEEDFNNYIVPYTEFEQSIIMSLASQTAIIFQRNILIEEKQQLFDSFIESMVTTIERRDKTTSGHSTRVAKLMKEFCKAVNAYGLKENKATYFDEKAIISMYYAGLLHDIGKIGVRESILLKRNKLTDGEMEAIKYRLYYYKNLLINKKITSRLDTREEPILEKLEEIYLFIKGINSKEFLIDEELGKLEEIGKLNFKDIDNLEKPLLTAQEITNLSVKRGNLTEGERRELELHSEYTYHILKDIAWGSQLNKVPEITAGHHEKLNGKGYPKGLMGAELNIETRMLAIADIFEALTAVDRPYKKPTSIEKAIDILLEEASKEELDSELVNIFIQEKVYMMV